MGCVSVCVCVRGVNLRLSQPEATMGCCGKTISCQALKGRGGWDKEAEGVVKATTDYFMIFNLKNSK